MIQLAFLLLGAEAVRRHWLLLAVVGLVWASLGVLILFEAVERIHGFTMHLLGFLLVTEGLVAVVVRISGHRTRLWAVKSLGLIVPGIAIVETPLRNLMLISILFGVALMADSIVRTVSIFLVRFPGWQIALFGTSVEFVLAALAITPWPVTYEATIPFCVSVALMISGWTVVRSAFALRQLAPGAAVTSLPMFEHGRGWHTSVQLSADDPAANSKKRMIVHVWTPVASSADPVRRPLVDRYVAAVDRQGAVSTGHAALEMPPDLYISHYRSEEVDRTRSEFRQALHAGPRNNVPGRFLSSYAEEAADWCEATVDVVFQRFSEHRLRAFWKAYSNDTTYNLTNRNCSVVVAQALDAALEGVLARRAVWPPFLRLLINPELYLATVLRRRALTMTWTPGLVLDYARALQRVVEPPPLSWPALLVQAISHWWQAWRYGPLAASRRGQNAEPATTAPSTGTISLQ